MSIWKVYVRNMYLHVWVLRLAKKIACWAGYFSNGRSAVHACWKAGEEYTHAYVVKENIGNKEKSISYWPTPWTYLQDESDAGPAQHENKYLLTNHSFNIECSLHSHSSILKSFFYLLSSNSFNGFIKFERLYTLRDGIW